MSKAFTTKFVARQAILDRNENVFAYELLYRNSNNNFFPSNVTDEAATARLFLDSLLYYGLENLGNNKKLFINLSVSSIISDLPKLIPPNDVVLEIIERVNKPDKLLPMIENLMKTDYIFALDDYDGDPKWNRLLQKVAYIKLEVGKNLEKTLEQISVLKKTFPNKKVIVERIEDHASFESVREAGADLFQGYYFTKPKLLNFQNINSSRLAVLDLLKVTLRTPFDFSLLINKVEKDPGLIIRLLRLSNLRCKSSRKISSIAQAVVYLGENTIKQFVTVLSLGDLGESKPSELLKLGLIRGKFIELILEHDKHLSDAGYLLGIVSIFSALVDVDMSFVFKELSLDHELKESLENQSGTLGYCYALCLKIENNDALDLQDIKVHIDADETFIMDTYAKALHYADESLS